jgi:hypothetical protein
MVKGKYTAKVIYAINQFWQKNHYPPTTRDIMEICEIPSTSHTRVIVKSLDNIRLAKHGRIIPKWVDECLGR